MEKKVECPICGRLFPKSVISVHADRCLDETDIDDEFTSDGSLPSENKRSRVEQEGNVTPNRSPRCSSPVLCDLGLAGSPCVPLSGCISLSHTTTQNTQSAKMCSNINQSLEKAVQPASTSTGTSQTSKRHAKPANLCDFFTVPQKSGRLNENKPSSGSVKPAAAHLSSLKPDVQLLNLMNENMPTKTAGDVSDTVVGSSSKAVESKSTVMAVSGNLTAKQTIHLLTTPKGVPLAEHMRPTMLADFVGQGHVVGSKRPLRSLLESTSVSSMILWGPPGCGKVRMCKYSLMYLHRYSSSLM